MKMSENSAIVQVFSDVLMNITLSQRSGSFASILAEKLKSLVKGKYIPLPTQRKHNEKSVWLNYLWMIKVIRDHTPEKHEYFSQTHSDSLSVFDDYSVKVDEDTLVVIDVLIMAIMEASRVSRSKGYQCLTKEQVGCVGSKGYVPHEFEPQWGVIISRLQAGPAVKEVIAEEDKNRETSEVSSLFQGLKFVQCETSADLPGGDGGAGSSDWGDDDLAEVAGTLASPPVKEITDPLSRDMVQHIMEQQRASEAVARETVMATVVSEYFRDKVRLDKFLKEHEKVIPYKVAKDDSWKLDVILGELKAIREDINQRMRVDVIPGPSVLSEIPQPARSVNVLANRQSGSAQLQGASKSGPSDQINWDNFFD